MLTHYLEIGQLSIFKAVLLGHSERGIVVLFHQPNIVGFMRFQWSHLVCEVVLGTEKKTNTYNFQNEQKGRQVRAAHSCKSSGHIATCLNTGLHPARGKRKRKMRLKKRKSERERHRYRKRRAYRVDNISHWMRDIFNILSVASPCLHWHHHCRPSQRFAFSYEETKKRQIFNTIWTPFGQQTQAQLQLPATNTI